MFEENSKKKRNRLSLSCNYCKKRKVKCDRGRPACLACHRYNVADQCAYSSDAPKSEVDKIEEELPENDDYDRFEQPKLRKISNSHIYPTPHDPPSINNGHPSMALFKQDGPANSKNVPTAVYSELEALKDKIKQLEASITVSNLSHASPGSTITQLSGSGSGSGSDDKKTNSQNTGILMGNPESPATLPKLRSISLPVPRQSFLEGNIRLPSIGWSVKSPSLNLESNVRNQDDEYRPSDFISLHLGVVETDPDDPDETINFYSGYTPIHIKDRSRRINHGPHSWLSLMKCDSGLRALWAHFSEKKKNVGLSVPPPPFVIVDKKPLNAPPTENEDDFTAKALDQDGYDDIKPYSEVKQNTAASITSDPSESSSREARIQMNRHAIALGLTVFEGKLDQELHLVEKIRVVLPKQKVIWKLVNLFFTSIYFYVPIIDELSFKNELVRLIGPEDYNDSAIPFFRVEKRLDFAYVAILLTILRFTYLAKFSNKHEENESIIQSHDAHLSEIKYLLLNPISIDVISLAQLCLDQFDLTRKSNLIILQTALLMRIYHMFLPEDGDGADGGQSQIYNGMLVQMAYSLGVNREPDLFPEVLNDEKENNLSRKVWYFLKLNDVSHAAQYGNPIIVDAIYSDVKMPYYKKGNENVVDSKMDQIVTESIRSSGTPYDALKQLLILTLNILNQIKITDLTAKVVEFELNLNKWLGKLTDYTRTPPIPNTQPFVKVKKCKALLNLKNFTLSIYYHLYLHYERNGKNDLTFFYIKKIMSIMFSEEIPEYINLIQNNRLHFDPNSTIADLILNPSVQSMIHRNTQFAFSLLIRLNNSIHRMKKNPEVHGRLLIKNDEYKLRYAKLCKLSKLIEKLAKFSIGCMTKLSGRYYYAWRISKAHSFILPLMLLEKFYSGFEDNFKHLQFPNFRDDQINVLSSICESVVRQLKEHDFETKENDKQFIPQQREKPYGPTSEFKPPYSRNNLYPTFDLSDNNSKNAFLSLNSASPASNSSFELDDFIQKDTSEIDRLWLQMVSMKNNDSYLENNSELNNGSFGNDQLISDQLLQQNQPFTPGALNGVNVDGNQPDDIFAKLTFDNLYNI